jgi:hypothetical protein
MLTPPAVIGLVILGLFYINRRSKNKLEPDLSTPQQPEVGYAPGHGPESPPLGYGPPADFRGSMFKSPYETNSVSVGSPPTSPTFPGEGGGSVIAQYHTPPPVEPYQTQTPNQNPQVEQYQAQAPVQVQQAQQAQQQQYQAPPPQLQQPQPGGHIAPGAQPQQAPVYPDQRYELSIERGDGEMRELPGRG